MSHLNALQPKLDEDLILIQTLSGEYIEICADEDDGGYEGTRKNQERKKNKPEKTKKKGAKYFETSPRDSDSTWHGSKNERRNSGGTLRKKFKYIDFTHLTFNQ